MEKLNEMSVKLKECASKLENINDFNSENKVAQAVVVIGMAQTYIEDAIHKYEDKAMLECKLTDCFCAITSVLETLDSALKAEHDIVWQVGHTLNDIA